MSSPERIVVVGGGPAGMEAARTYRAAGGRGTVTLVTADPHLPYRRPPLTKDYLRTGSGRDALLLEPAAWFSTHGVEVRHAPVVALDPDGGRLELLGGDTLGFDACVLATGSEPVRPPVPGVDLDGVLVLRTLDDADALRARVLANARRAVVVGSGFIGCEAAMSLRDLGCEVTLVSGEPAPQTARLGEAAGRQIAGWLEGAGVELHLGTHVAELREAPNAHEGPRGGGSWALEVLTDDGEPAIGCDVVVLGAGVSPRLELARSAGLAIDEGAPGVRCDAGLRTSHPRVWAGGDIAVAEHPLAGRPLRVEHWGDALAHGEAIGKALAGGAARWETVPGFWSTIGERTLKLAAWGDGWERDHLVAHPGGGFTVSYERGGACVGVLTHDADADYERGKELVGRGAPVPRP